MTIHGIGTFIRPWRTPAQGAMILGLAALLIAFLSAGSLPAAQETKSPTDIKISFMLDSRITRGMYMGERWVSPPTYSVVRPGKEVTTEARAEGLDAQGKPMDINPEWIPADPDMVEVSPGQGQRVKITVRRPGQSRLKVVSPGFSKELLIKATVESEAIRLEISR